MYAIKWGGVSNQKSQIYNPKLQKPRAKQRGAFSSEESLFSGSVSWKDAPSCLAVYFTWPQVALTHHAVC
jgi:hypothetical protein